MLLIFVVNMHELFLWKTKMVLQLLMLPKNLDESNNPKPSKIWVDSTSTLVWVGFLVVSFEVERGMENDPLYKTRSNFARNLKFGT